MSKIKTAIISNGQVSDYEHLKSVITDCDYIICADGGLRHAFHLKIVPDTVIGDLDSTPSEIINYYKNQNVQFIEYSSDKDKSDTQLCLEYALEFSEEILMMSALGSRIDHTIANISLLKLGLEKNKIVRLIDAKNEICMINKELAIKGTKGDIVSLIPMSEKVTGINITGVHYELFDAVMEIGNPYGVSNYFENESVHISIDSGYLLVIRSSD